MTWRPQRLHRLTFTAFAIILFLYMYDGLYVIHLQPQTISLRIAVQVIAINIISMIALFTLLMKIAYIHRMRRRASCRQYAQHTQSQTASKTPTDAELKKLYHELLKKYHPDLTRGEEDKIFRSNLTAKINKAYAERDFATLNMFR